MVNVIPKNEFENLIDYLSKLWPETLDVTDKVQGKRGGLRIPKLVAVHDDVEENIERNYDGLKYNYANTVEFAIFKYLHSKIKANGLDSINRKDIDSVEVRKIINTYEDWGVES